MHYSKDIENMICVAKGVSGKFEHGPAPIPEEGLWVKAKEIKDIKGLTHGIGWCALCRDGGGNSAPQNHSRSA